MKLSRIDRVVHKSRPVLPAYIAARERKRASAHVVRSQVPLTLTLTRASLAMSLDKLYGKTVASGKLTALRD